MAGLPYPPKHGHDAHGDLLFDRSGDDLGMGDTGVVIGKNCIRREARVTFLATIGTMKWNNKLMNIDPVFDPRYD